VNNAGTISKHGCHLAPASSAGPGQRNGRITGTSRVANSGPARALTPPAWANGSTGIITGGFAGIGADTVNVTANTGTITGGQFGIRARTLATVNNAGTDSGHGHGCVAIRGFRRRGRHQFPETAPSRRRVRHQCHHPRDREQCRHHLGWRQRHPLPATANVTANTRHDLGGAIGILADTRRREGEYRTITVGRSASMPTPGDRK